MTDRTLEADVAVIGGGPAGTVASRRLATLGYTVVVAHEPCRHDRIETLPPSLSLLGHDVLASDRLASIAEPVRSITSSWSGEEVTTRDSPGSSMVARRRFDQLLLHEAARAGVVVLAPARARAPHRASGRWIVPVTRSDKTIQIVARFLLDARGRRGGKRRHTGRRTLALSARWTEAGLAPGEMRIAAHPEGWCWAAASSNGAAEVTAFVDLQTSAGTGRGGLRQRYLGMLSDTPLFAALPANATPGSLAIGDATASTATEPATADRLAVGDAALTVDPLSAHGIVIACRMALQSAAVIHTILGGGDSAPALSFYAGRVAAVGRQHAQSVAALYGEHDRWGDRDFWRMRRELVAQAATSIPAPTKQALAQGPLRLSSAARLTRVPALVGDKIELCNAIDHPNLADPVVRLGRFDLPALMPRLGGGHHAAGLVAGLSDICSPEEARSLLDWLTRMGLLEPITAAN